MGIQHLGGTEVEDSTSSETSGRACNHSGVGGEVGIQYRGGHGDRRYHLVSAVSALQRIHDFCLVLSISPFQPVSCFSGFCVSAVSFSMVFVVHFSVSTSFLFQRFLRSSGFIKSPFHITTSPFQTVSRFSGSCVSAVSLSPNWLSTPRFQPIFRFSICGEGRKKIAPCPKLRYVLASLLGRAVKGGSSLWGRGEV